MKSQLKELWTDAKTPLDYFVAVWIYILIGLAGLGLGKVLFEIVTDPIQFKSIQFGGF